MKILSLETTSEFGSVAVLENGSVVSEIFFESSDVAGQLLFHTGNILCKSGLAPSDIDYFVVSIGPGSWTGTRVGISFAKGLAGGNSNRIYAISAPQSFFFGLKWLKLPAICLINAYGGKMYLSHLTGRFYYKKDYLPYKADCKDIHAICGKKEAVLTGPGVVMLSEKTKKLGSLKIPESYFLCPRAGLNGLLAWEKIKRNIPSLPLKPYYGR